MCELLRMKRIVPMLVLFLCYSFAFGFDNPDSFKNSMTHSFSNLEFNHSNTQLVLLEKIIENKSSTKKDFGFSNRNAFYETKQFDERTSLVQNKTYKPNLFHRLSGFNVTSTRKGEAKSVSSKASSFVMTLPSNGASTVDCPSQATNPGSPASVVDDCGSTVTPTLKTTPTPVDCEGTMVWEYEYVGCNGDTQIWTYTYTIDMPATDFTLIPDAGVTVDCVAQALSTPTTPPLKDACDRDIVPTIKTQPTAVSCEGTMAWVFTYTDCTGSSHDWTYTYTVDMPDGMTIPVDGSSTVDCPANATDPGAPATIQDKCGNDVVPTLKTTPSVVACEGTMIWEYEYKDCANNIQIWKYTYTIDMPDGMTIPADGSSTVDCPADATDPGAPATIQDKCGNDVVPTLKTTPSAVACEGTMIWEYEYKDCANNIQIWKYTYTIDMPDGMTLPADGSSTVGCPSQATDPGPPANIQDECGRTVTPTLKTTPTPVDCEGTMVWEYEYKDCADNAQTWKYTYTVDRPDFTIPADGTAQVQCIADASVTPTTPTVVDACGVTLTPVLTSNPTDNPPDCEGTMAWVFTYTDCAGNSHDWTYTYTIDQPDFTIPSDGASTVDCLADAKVQPTPPAVTDYCGRELTPDVTTPNDIACEGTMDWVFTYTDCAGHSHDWKYTYTIDIPDFVANMPADGGSTVDCLADAKVQPTPPAVTDACGNAITPSLTTTPNDIACEGDMAWVFTYADCTGTSHDWTYTYTIDIPDFTVPADDSSTVDCLVDAKVQPTPPTVTDACGNTLTPTVTTPADESCEGDMAWVFTYADCTGTSHDWTYTYTIDIPDFTVPADGSSTVDCLADAKVQPTPPTVTDACGNTLTPTVAIPADVECEGDMAWVFTYTDCTGTSHDWTYTYTIDILDFVANMPDDAGLTVDCLSDATQPTAPAVNDNCGNQIIPTIKSEPDPTCDGPMVWVFNYEDCVGNNHDWTYTYIVDMPDSMNLPADGSDTVDCPADAVDPGAPATIQDHCGNDVVPTLITTPTPVDCEGTMVWEYEYRDCADHVQVWRFTYTVDMPDGMTIPEDGMSTVDCPADATDPGAPATIQDKCGNDVVPTLKTTPNAVACEGDMVWEYEYKDCADNVQVWTYTYTVDMPDGMTIPDDGSLTVDCPADATDPGAPATIQDACGNDVVPTLKTTPTAVDCEGEMVWVYEYKDCADNAQEWTYTYTVDMPDGMTIPDDGSSTVNCAADAVDPGAPATIQDACGNDVVPTLKTTPEVIECEGDMVWEYEYKDCADNVQVWTYTYTIDIPDFTMPNDASLAVDCVSDATQPTAPAVLDYCGNPITPTVKTIPDENCNGDMVWVFNYEDCAGNSHDWTYTYTVSGNDSTPPTGTAPDDITVDCDSKVPAADPEAITDEADNCGGTVTVTVADTDNGGSGCSDDPKVITRTFTLTDCSGHQTELVQTITVKDETPPTWTSAAGSLDREVSCEDTFGLADAQALEPMATDDGCTDDANIVYTKTSGQLVAGDCANAGTYTNTWVAKDACDNTTVDVFTQVITIVDDLAPVITPPADATITVACGESIPDPETLTYTDNCGASGTATYSEEDHTVDQCAGYSFMRKWTATDECGNSSEVTQNVVVEACGSSPVINNVDIDDEDCVTATLTLSDITASGTNVTYILVDSDWPGFTGPVEQSNSDFDLTGGTYADFQIRDEDTGCLSAVYSTNFGCALAVTLRDFEVAQAQDCINISWETLSEGDNNKFIIQNSFDGVRFNDLVEIEGRGTRSTGDFYSHCDYTKYCDNVYYRLKQVDMTGKENYFPVKTISQTCEATAPQIVPNPFKDEVTIYFTSEEAGLANVRVIDATGRVHFVNQEKVRRGENRFTYNLGELSRSQYYFQIINSNGEIQTVTGVKIK